jgi:hypothetical protein
MYSIIKMSRGAMIAGAVGVMICCSASSAVMMMGGGEEPEVKPEVKPKVEPKGGTQTQICENYS